MVPFQEALSVTKLSTRATVLFRRCWRNELWKSKSVESLNESLFQGIIKTTFQSMNHTLMVTLFFSILVKLWTVDREFRIHILWQLFLFSNWPKPGDVRILPLHIRSIYLGGESIQWTFIKTNVELRNWWPVTSFFAHKQRSHHISETVREDSCWVYY